MKKKKEKIKDDLRFYVLSQNLWYYKPFVRREIKKDKLRLAGLFLH
jgi:uncharacterized protein YneR